jgi:hypothetical protein
MNERIRELAEQASKEAFPVGSMAWMETFAELIVRECADLIDSHEQVDKYGEAMNIVYGEDLIKHFGVER